MQIAQEEFNPSREKGFPTLWSVARSYQIQDGVLRREKGESLRAYAPIVHLELPNEISKLKVGDETGLLNFATTYGELGYVFFKERPNKKAKGDPVQWFWTHAQTIHLCLELIHAIKHNDERLILATLVSERYQGQEKGWRRMAYGPKIHNQKVILGERTKVSPINEAETVLRSIINPNLRNLHPKLVLEKEGLQLRFTFSALVEVAYWQLANTYVGGWLKRCAADGCGAIFLQTDQRQQFCPKGLRQESLCASRDRLKRFRENQKAVKGSKRTSSKGNKIDKRKGGAQHGKKRR